MPHGYRFDCRGCQLLQTCIEERGNFLTEERQKFWLPSRYQTNGAMDATEWKARIKTTASNKINPTVKKQKCTPKQIMMCPSRTATKRSMQLGQCNQFQIRLDITSAAKHTARHLSCTLNALPGKLIIFVWIIVIIIVLDFSISFG